MYRLGLSRVEQHTKFCGGEWQWRARSCRVFWSRVFWNRVVLKEVQRVTWGSHTTGSSFAPGAAAQPPVCLALFSLWTLLHLYFSWYSQSAYSMATFPLLWSVWILLWLWNEKYMVYGSQPILYLETKQYNQFCIKQHHVTVKFSNCKGGWYCGESWYYQRNSHHEEARMHEG